MPRPLQTWSIGDRPAALRRIDPGRSGASGDAPHVPGARAPYRSEAALQASKACGVPVAGASPRRPSPSAGRRWKRGQGARSATRAIGGAAKDSWCHRTAQPHRHVESVDVRPFGGEDRPPADAPPEPASRCRTLFAQTPRRVGGLPRSSYAIRIGGWCRRSGLPTDYIGILYSRLQRCPSLRG